MLRPLLVRAAAGVAVIWGVVTLVFLLLHVAPGNPAELLVGPAASPSQIAAQRHALGLDRPLPEQYAAWLGRFVRGDWGTSIVTGRPVRSMLLEAWPATARLVVLSLLLSYALGIALGVMQASRSGSRFDTAMSISSVTLFAMPGYWLGLMLVMVFTYRLHLLPAFGAGGLDAEFLPAGARMVDSLRHLALPLTTLTLIGVGGVARFVRGSMIDLEGSAFLLTARAKGLGSSRVLIRHTLRNALIPVLTLLGLSLPAVFSGTVFVEAIYAWPGVGRVLVEAVQARDHPVVLAAVAVSAGLVVVGNLLAEALVAWADPRTRTSHA
ncbi:MAG TPA: ABC transporter permease [Gemmatimonadales bacterium]|jgi:peptide/nickel transport system permease protein|nr:ABC transporter permease [Gemmatimonadales bacterium]